MILLDRSKVKMLASWSRHVEKAFPDLQAFLTKATEFEALDIDDPVRRAGFLRYAAAVLPRKRRTGACYFKAIWGKAKKAIALMSHQKCAYCESAINAERLGEVEHFKPKSLFPLLVYDWDNYFLGCGGCNGAKADKWPAGGMGYIRPDIGDPSILFRFLENGSVEADDPTGAAQRMIEDLDLNRAWLCGLRKLAIEMAVEQLNDLGAIRDRIPGYAFEQMANNLKGRIQKPALPYAAAVMQCFARAWRRLSGAPL